MFDWDDFFDSIEDEERMDARAQRQYEARLAQHPDCRDPDHPGCELCNEEDGHGY